MKNFQFRTRVIPVDKEGRPLKLEQGFNIGRYDRVDADYPSDTQEVYTFSKRDRTTKIIQITYTDSTKENLLRVEVI